MLRGFVAGDLVRRHIHDFAVHCDAVNRIARINFQGQRDTSLKIREPHNRAAAQGLRIVSEQRGSKAGIVLRNKLFQIEYDNRGVFHTLGKIERRALEIANQPDCAVQASRAENGFCYSGYVQVGGLSAMSVERPP